MIGPAISILGALVCAVCAALLLRGWRRSSARLLLWSGVCFLFLALNNSLQFVDDVLLPDRDLRLLTDGAALLGVAVLLYGLIWDRE